MIFNIKVVTNAKQSRTEKTGDNSFRVYINQKPEKGKANEAIIELLSEYFGIAKKRVFIKSGLKSRNKIIEVI